MKKFISLMLVFVMAVSMTACSQKSPESVVKTYCEAIKAFDAETASSCVKGEDERLDSLSDISDDRPTARFYEYLKKNAAEINYTIGGTVEEGERATVQVSFTFVDASPIMSAAMGEYLVQGLAMAFTGADEKQMEELFTSILMEKIESVETGTTEAEVIFDCVKTDGEWKIDTLSDENRYTLANIITCNIAESLSGIADTLG